MDISDAAGGQQDRGRGLVELAKVPSKETSGDFGGLRVGSFSRGVRGCRGCRELILFLGG